MSKQTTTTDQGKRPPSQKERRTGEQESGELPIEVVRSAGAAGWCGKGVLIASPSLLTRNERSYRTVRVESIGSP